MSTSSGGPDGGGRRPGHDERYCASCGAVIKERAELCPECGVRQEPPDEPREVDRASAAVLALVLGGVGAHKFYLGKTGQGALYLCFFWTLIPPLIGFLEGVTYLNKTDAAFQEQYG